MKKYGIKYRFFLWKLKKQFKALFFMRMINENKKKLLSIKVGKKFFSTPKKLTFLKLQKVLPIKIDLKAGDFKPKNALKLTTDIVKNLLSTNEKH